MKTIFLAREDLQNPLHPFLFDQLVEELGLHPDTDMIELRVASAKSDVEE